MATEEVVQIDSREMFESAIAPEPVVTEPEQPKADPVTDATGRLHGEDGKFVPKQAKEADAAPIQQSPVETQPSEPAQADDDAKVPSWRLRELREQREAVEGRERELQARLQAQERQVEDFRRQLAELTKPKPQEPVNFFDDPQAAVKQQLTPFETQFQELQRNLTLRASRAEAIADYGKPEVAEMEKAIGKAMQEHHPDMAALKAQMVNSDHPVDVAMNWFRKDKLLKETGGDITAYKTKLTDELLKDPAFLAKAMEAARVQAGGSPTKTAVQLPPSLSKQTGASLPGGDDNDMSEAALFRHAMGSPRRK